MKVAVVLMPWYRRESPSPELALTIALLKPQNHKIYVYDINNEMFNSQFSKRGYWRYFLLDAPPELRDSFFEETREIFEYISSQILSADPEAIIFKIIGKTYLCSVQMAKILKEKDSKKIIIFTGSLVASVEDVKSFVRGQNELPFDFTICGEDEVVLPKLLGMLEAGRQQQLALLFEKRGKVINCLNGPIVEDLDTLPFYDFSDFDLNAYKFPDRLEIFISKGCPWHCSFCVDWLTEKRYRSMSGERIYKEILHQSKIHNTKHFRFCDKTINGDINALNTFCNLLLEGHREGLDKICWSGDAMIRPEMTKELLIKMRKTGCVGLGYGLESGSQNVVEKMGKRFSIDLAKEVLRNTRGADIHTDVNILVGFPTETYNDFQETLSFIERNREFIDEIRLTYVGCRILRYSILYNYPERFNLANTDTDFWSTKDGLNTYEERQRRYEIICQRILDLGIDLRVNSRITKKVVKAV